MPPKPPAGPDPAAVERQREVKALLKGWEAEFLREERRRPSQADIEAAPEETRRLYKEYRMLKKQLGEALDPSGKTGSQEIPPVEQDSGFWGSHLNRKPKIPGKSRSGSGMSAQFYGMKLKSKLGATGKEPPLTPHRTPNPRRIPAIPRFRTHLEPSGNKEESGKPGDPGDSEDSGALILPPSLSGMTPLILTSGMKPPHPPPPEKFQQLKRRVAQTLGSLDPAWLRRCQEIPGKEEIPAGTARETGETDTAGAAGRDSTRKRPAGNPAGDRDAPKKLQRHHLKEGKLGMKRSREEEEEEEVPKESGKTSGNILERLGNTLEEGEDKEKQVGAPKKRRKSLENLLEEGEEHKEKHMEALKKRRKTSKRLENLLEEEGEEQEKQVGAPKKRRKTSKRLENLQEEGEEEQEKQVEAPKGSRQTLERLENLWEEEEEEQEKPKPARKTRAAPRNGGNFVRLNLRRKSYTRFSLRGKSLRKQVWREKWRKKSERFGGGGSDVCFRCGETGHWASECRGRDSGSLPAENDPKDEEEEEEDPLPTLEEVARRTNTVIPGISASGSNAPGSCLDTGRPEYAPCPPPTPVEPLYSPGADGTVPDPPPEVLEALRELGYASFRPGQAVAVMRILCGLSTLVVLPTGTGKSLCYQLPALLFHRRRRALALVVSPLVALMDDQVSGLPPCLRAVRLHSNMSRAQRESVMEKVRAGEVQVLLLSPEALVGGGGSGSAFPAFRDRLPPVAFACLDEAHCVSQWCHNFRPSYLRVCKVLRERLGVRCFLGLTATATAGTARDVARHLGTAAPVRGPPAAVPPNLRLSVSTDRDRDQALVSLLRGERFGALDSVIVYCTRREETERVAALIRTRLQGIPAPGRDGKDFCLAEAYHAGLPAAERRRVQRRFAAGRLRVLVATVAFGMGLDKPDVRAVVHYNLPRDLESYVQEIGRAGRDGRPARCHLFLDPEGRDLPELRRHIYGDTVEFWAIKELVLKVFAPCKCRRIHGEGGNDMQAGEAGDAETAELLEEEDEEKLEKLENPGMSPLGRVCPGHERSLPVRQTVESLDVREEGIETLLCYLELHPRRWLELLLPTYSSCRIRCSGGPRQLRDVARSCPPVAVFLARERLEGREHRDSGAVELDVVALSDSMGWEAALVKRQLRQLQWDPRLRRGKSGILVEFGELSFHFRAFGDLSDRELDSVCHFLHRRVVSREKAALSQLRACFRAFQSVAFQACDPQPPEEEEEERSSRLKALLQEYFERDGHGSEGDEAGKEEEELSRAQLQDWESQVRSDIRRFLSIRPDEKFSGRAIARIFHGISSPRFPAQIYGRDRRFWRKHLQLDFHGLSRLATEEILATM